MSSYAAALDNEDEFYPSDTWPDDFKRLFNAAHVTRYVRFKLILFFWRNGVEMHKAVAWVMSGSTRFRRDVRYDRSAWLSAQDMINQSRSLSGRSYLSSLPMFEYDAERVVRHWRGRTFTDVFEFEAYRRENPGFS